MFIPLLMRRVDIYVLREEAHSATLTLARLGIFGPDSFSRDDTGLSDIPGQRYAELYHDAHAMLVKVLSHLSLIPERVEVDSAEPVDEATLNVIEVRLRELWNTCSANDEEGRHLAEQRKILQHQNHTLDKFTALDIDFSRLRRETGLLDLRLGAMPEGNVSRLRNALGLAGYLLKPFSITEGTAHVVIAGLEGGSISVDQVLESAGCKPMTIPVEFASHPDTVRRELARQRAELESREWAVRRRVEATRKQYAEQLRELTHMLAAAAPYAEVAPSLYGQGGLARLSGWVPKRHLEQVRVALKAQLGDRYTLTSRPAHADERSQVPSALDHPALLRPFLALVKNYGIPRYGEVDPTLLFTATFVAMYGMMFGDLGHGGVIVAAGLVFRRRLWGFAPFVIAIGISSMLFGLIYGSLFGYEHVVEPLWMSPLSDPGLMLVVAFFWGVSFILLASLLAIRNRFVARQPWAALFDGRGLAGLSFYLSGLYLGYAWFEHGRPGVAGLVLAAVSLVVVMAYQWHGNKLPFGERLMVVLIETFETAMNYIANTLSFLRVAAFSLNHVALAVAVFTLADMFDTTGHWLAVVLGNLFILVLEGAIVAIQVLRLEYYEGFSRFYSGDGREFKPLKLSTVLSSR